MESIVTPHADCDGCRGLIYGICSYTWDVMTTGEKRDAQEDWSEARLCTACKLYHCSCKQLDLMMLPSKRKGRKPAPPSANVSSDRWFVTVSVKPDAEIPKLWKRVEKFMSMCKCNQFVAQMDQSGIDEYKHPHVHMYVEYPKPLYKSKVIQVFSCAFTDYVGGDNYIDVKIGGDHHVKYCQGIKVDEKQEIVHKSKLYRQEYNLPDYIAKDA